MEFLRNRMIRLAGAFKQVRQKNQAQDDTTEDELIEIKKNLTQLSQNFNYFVAMML